MIEKLSSKQNLFNLVICDISSFSVIENKKDIFSKLIKIFSDYSKKYKGFLDNLISNFAFIFFENSLNSLLFAKEINKKIKEVIENNIETGIKTILLKCEIISGYNNINYYNIFNKRIEDFLPLLKKINYFDIVVSDELARENSNLFIFESINDSNFYRIIERESREKNNYNNIIPFEMKEEIKRLNNIILEKISKRVVIESDNFSGKSSLINQFVNKNDLLYIKINPSLNSYHLSILNSIYDSIIDLIYFLDLQTKKKIDSSLKILSLFLNNENRIISKYFIFESLKNILIEISKINKFLIIIEDCDYLDNGSLELINFIIKSTKNYNIFFILSKNIDSNIHFYKKDIEYIKITKSNLLPSIESINEKIENLKKEEIEILKIMAVYGEEIDIYLLKRILGSRDIEDSIDTLCKINILEKKNRKEIYNIRSKSIHNLILRNITDEEKIRINNNIAKILIEYYSNSSYEKIAIHLENSKNIKDAILYYFLAGIKYRDTYDYSPACKMFDKCIKLASSSDIKYFTENEIEVLNYNILKPFWNYKIKLRLSLSLLYYFRISLTFPYEEGYEDKIEKLIDVCKEEQENLYIYVLSYLEYFNYLLFNKFKLDLNILSTIENKVKESKDELLIGIFYSYYILILISKNFPSDLSKKNILDNFFLSKEIVIKSKRIDKVTKKSFLAYWYDNYISYLKVEGKNLNNILTKILKGAKYCTGNFQKMSYFLKISSVMGPLNKTEYEEKFVKKALIYSKRSFSYINIMHCYSSLGYLSLLNGKYIQSLEMNKRAKYFAFLLEDKLELGMIYKNLGDLYLCLNNYKNGEYSYKKSVKYKEEIESTKTIVDFNNIIFPKTALCYALIKNKKFEEARDLLHNIESNISRVFFGNEIPIFLNFLRQLLILKDKYCEDYILKMKKCYFDIKNINPEAIQLIWIKNELKEYGVIV